MKKNKIGSTLQIYTLALGILTLVLAWFFIIPKAKEIIDISGRISQEETTLGKLRAKIADLQGLNEVELSERNSLVLKALPSNKDAVGVMAVLNSLSATNGLIPESFKVAPGEISATSSGIILGRMRFDVTYLGSLDQIKSFLKDLQKGLPLINPVDVEIGFLEGAAKLRLESYFEGLPKDLGRVDATITKLSSAEEKTIETISPFTYFPQTTYSPGIGGKYNFFSP